MNCLSQWKVINFIWRESKHISISCSWSNNQLNTSLLFTMIFTRIISQIGGKTMIPYFLFLSMFNVRNQRIVSIIIQLRIQKFWKGKPTNMEYKLLRLAPIFLWLFLQKGGGWPWFPTVRFRSIYDCSEGGVDLCKYAACVSAEEGIDLIPAFWL